MNNLVIRQLYTLLNAAHGKCSYHLTNSAFKNQEHVKQSFEDLIV